ncbi:MAG TPA: DEAD/DEAH box helicase family protein [Baekduia sp.]|uniref:DEAD/DEAH box helicase family protein n=1 Tax=Baekduia sp. TaxID=2600305 RepID=UPI002D7859F9|nr:DEAD/DEAH box helicase family protein [Baekduia sp.]HET6508718.1 DEAD/DEAH box helicase family protein [Baekduia sp.]
MAEPTTAVEAAPVPDPTLVAKAEAFTRERFVHEGEDAASALAPGSARRRAFDAALAEIERGEKVPSTKWRRRYALLLGLERVLSEDEPVLADGTHLNPHQVDALSGTLVALLARTQRALDASGAEAEAAAPVLAVEEAPAPEPDPAAEASAEPDHDEPDLEDDEDDEPEDRTPVDVEIEGLEDDDEDEEEPPSEEESYDDEAEEDVDEDIEEGAADDPNAGKRFWFEHATGAGKTVAAMGFVEASRTGGVLILTHRRNLVDQFLGELHTRGYGKRESPPLLDGEGTGRTDGPVTVETYQWFVRNAGRISDAYTIVICDEAHTALGDKTSAAIRAWTGPIFVGMTATGALIARHVTDLFPTQTSRFDLAQAARRGVIAPLRSIRIPPGPGVRTIAKVPLRKGEVDVEFDQEMLAELLDQLPFNLAIADLYKTRFNGVPGVVYAAGVRHAMNVAEAFREVGIKAMGVSGETPKRELAEILAKYERGEIDVLVNAQLLAEGWNSPRATICMHLAPTASKRIYQQRVGRVTRRHPGKESGIVVDFVHPATRHDDPVVTLHSLLDRDVYRGGAIVVGPVRRGRGRRVRVERRVIPVTADPDRRIEVFERELWRIAVEFLDYGEQVQWAALAGARVAPSGWRRARAMLHFDKSGELKRSFLLTAVERNKNSQLRLRALQEIAQSRDADAFERAVDVVRLWSRDERREGVKVLLQALAERRIGRRDQASHWIWDLADMTREVHEEYAVQRWPETKRLLGLLVNSSGGAHARNARRLVHAARKQDRRLSAALLAAAVAHTPEAMEVVRGARTRMARKPSALSRELLRNFPKRKNRSRRRRGKKGDGQVETPRVEAAVAAATVDGEGAVEQAEGAAVAAGAAAADGSTGEQQPRKKRRRSRRKSAAARAAEAAGNAEVAGNAEAAGSVEAAASAEGDGSSDAAAAGRPPVDDEEAARGIEAAAALLAGRGMPVAPPREAADAGPEEEAPKPARRRRTPAKAEAVAEEAVASEPVADEAPKPARRRRTPTKAPVVEEPAVTPEPAAAEDEAPKKPARRRTAKAAPEAEAVAEEAPKPARRRTTKKATDAEEVAPEAEAVAEEAPKPARRRTTKKAADAEAVAPEAEVVAEEAPKPARRRTAKKAADAEAAAEEEAPKPARRRTAKKAADAEAAVPEAEVVAEEAPKPVRRRTAKKAADTEAVAEEAPKPARRRTAKKAADADATAEDEAPKPTRRRTTAKKAEDAADEAPKPTRRRTTKKADAPAADDAAEKPKRTRRAPVKAAAPEQLTLDEAAAEAPKARRSRRKADDDQLDDAA